MIEADPLVPPERRRGVRPSPRAGRSDGDLAAAAQATLHCLTAAERLQTPSLARRPPRTPVRDVGVRRLGPGVVGQVPVGVVGVEQRLGEQRAHVGVGGAVVHEGTLPAPHGCQSRRLDQPDDSAVLCARDEFCSAGPSHTAVGLN